VLRGPKIKLSIDLNRIDRYFPLDHERLEGFDFDITIDRQRYDTVAALLQAYGVSEEKIIQEICFIISWIEAELKIVDSPEGIHSKFYQMRNELDELQHYLLMHRITSISFRGEFGRKNEGEDFIMNEEINIDRVCDGLRTVFREEFDEDKLKRKTKGLAAWRRRKLDKVRNNFLNYFTSIQELDELSLEDQNDLIGKLIEMSALK
jgi:hypothetical protein